MKNKFKHFEGFTLIEVLVALLILSIGLLGIAGLQTRGQLNNYAAHIRTQASILAYEIMDKIRINRTFAVDDIVVGGTGYIVAAKPSDTDPDCDGATACTTPAQLRTYDLIEWYKHVAVALPNGNATIAWNVDNDVNTNDYTITISWTLKNDETMTNATSLLTWELLL